MTNSECIEWSGSKDRDGYALVCIPKNSLRYHGKKQLTQRASRVIFCKEQGIPLSEINGKVILHACDNPGCVNSKHLRLGTHAENSADMVAKGRQAKGKGAGRPPRLNESHVLAIRNRYASEGISQRKLARQYGIGQQMVQLIVTRQRWSWLA